jgi:hypothetical protein
MEGAPEKHHLVLEQTAACMLRSVTDRACMYHPSACDLLRRSSAVGAVVEPTRPLLTLNMSPAVQWEQLVCQLLHSPATLLMCMATQGRHHEMHR